MLHARLHSVLAPLLLQANRGGEQQAGSAFFDLPNTSSEAPTSPLSHRCSRSMATPRRKAHSPDGDLSGSPPQLLADSAAAAGAAGAAAWSPPPTQRQSVSGQQSAEAAGASGVHRTITSGVHRTITSSLQVRRLRAALELPACCRCCLL
jgi:hypothetical protein